MSDLYRRSFLLGGASLLATAMAGCATTAGTVVTAGGLGDKPVTGNGSRVGEPAAEKIANAGGADVPQHVVSMYAAVTNDRFPIRASNMELVPERFWRQDVPDPTGESPGTVIVNTTERFLYHVHADGTATRYGVGIGAAGFAWSGRAHIAYKKEWPTWTPPSDMIKRQPRLEKYRYGMEPGSDNPMGPRALYIHQGNKDTLYRIHGNPDEKTIGQAVSSGCVRMLPQDIIHLHDTVRSGSTLLVV